MGTLKYSPGPWTYDADEGELLDAKGELITFLTTQEPFDRSRADHALIAAAPEMLALLRECLPLARALRKAYSEPGFDDRSELCKSLEALLARLDG